MPTEKAAKATAKAGTTTALLKSKTRILTVCFGAVPFGGRKQGDQRGGGDHQDAGDQKRQLVAPEMKEGSARDGSKDRAKGSAGECIAEHLNPFINIICRDECQA